MWNNSLIGVNIRNGGVCSEKYISWRGSLIARAFVYIISSGKWIFFYFLGLNLLATNLISNEIIQYFNFDFSRATTMVRTDTVIESYIYLSLVIVRTRGNITCKTFGRNWYETQRAQNALHNLWTIISID